MLDATALLPKRRTCFRALVADDAPRTRLALSVAIKSFDASIAVIEAGDGRAAREALLEHRPDIAFVNVSLPEITGAEALAVARSQGVRPFTVLLSSLIVPHWVEISTELGAYEFLKKPLAQSEVDHILHAFCRMQLPVRVLVVDASQRAVEVVRKTLAGSQFKVEIEETDEGKHALKALMLATYDVVMIDVGTTGLDGLETACRIESQSPDTKVVLMSSGAGPLVSMAKLCGLSTGLRKPFYAPDVDVAFHRVFGLRRPYLLNARARSSVAVMDAMG